MTKVNLNIFVTFCVFIITLTGQATAVTHYVSPGQSIQAAIDDANDYDEIEVAPGTYPEAINFNGKAVLLYSSGGPELTTIDANGLNSTVVTCDSGEDSNTILEGFTVIGGNATSGGGMSCYGGSNPTVTNCTFSGNTANSGGGMRNNGSSPKVTNCTFSGNTAEYGGGMTNYGESSPTVTNCTLNGNIAAIRGGGMFNFDNSSPKIINCTFNGNTTDISGGGMYNNTSSPTVTNCIFSGNNAISGGGMRNWASSPSVTDCTFKGNVGSDDGGGMSSYGGSNPIVTNCTFSGNTSAVIGGGMFNSDSSPSLTNCILWGDEPNEIYNDNSAPTVTYSDVQGGTGQSWFGTGCIDADPRFVDVNNPDPNLWSLRLKPDSPCIDAGDTIAVPNGILVDADGNPRGVDDPQTPDTGISFLGVTVDMGAYEFDPCRIPGDNNCDGKVDFEDLAILCNNWLKGTEP